MAWKISYSILTSPKKEPYLDRTIKSLEETGFFENIDNLPLRIVPSIPDSAYLEKYTNDSRFCVEDMTRREASERMWAAAGEALRETWGHYRCLHPDRANPDSTHLLVLEDDIKFGKDWLTRLAAVVDELISLHGRRWLLTLYTPQTTEPLDAFKAGRRWASRPYNGFYGSQAILYPLGVRDEYMAYLTARPLDKPHDLALADVMKHLRIPMFTSAPCLVQHMELAAGGAKVHRSDSFIE